MFSPSLGIVYVIVKAYIAIAFSIAMFETVDYFLHSQLKIIRWSQKNFTIDRSVSKSIKR